MSNVKVIVVSDEVVNKFHDALCPKCNGNCSCGSFCEYDGTHKRETIANQVWNEYLHKLQVVAEKKEMSLEEIYELLIKNPEELNLEEIALRAELTKLF